MPIGKGVPPPAKLENVIKDLLQNQKTTNIDNSKTFTTFSHVNLTDAQKALLIYPSGFTPLDLYVLIQVDQFNVGEELVGTIHQLISFSQKDEKFFYGHYFDMGSQGRFLIKVLSESRKPIDLAATATFTPLNYRELYNDVNGTTVIISLFIDDLSPSNSFAGMQYTHRDSYYYERLRANGVVDPILPKISQTDLSENMERLVRKLE